MQIEHNGRTQSATAWAREIGISYHVLRWRLQHWSKEQALTTPKQAHGRQITHNGRTQSVNAWAHEIGITLQGLLGRLQRGETAEQALSHHRKTRACQK
jgi:hypothetical protein